MILNNWITTALISVFMLGNTDNANNTVPPLHNILQKNGWISLFDGKTTKGWTTYGKDTLGGSWKVEDGALHLDAADKSGRGDIIHNMELENFHLKLDWKIAKNGNSGIIFWAQNDPAKYKYVWYTGPEMQVLDNDGHPDAKIDKHRSGNLYDLVASKEGVTKAVGEWNTAEIISNRGKLEFKLNGISILTTTYGDEQWNQMIANSKFRSMPAFGKNFKGHIALQDHGDHVWYRNIMVKKL
ncbi:3-keto-disaccharide hydrolase [Sediminibacterium goheungense]|uniref:Uncharacterized protein DUF1080 n=1 Tax=Sediminibacterium goheungense TaxID=1086393 RepID=A0A4R6IUS9_9BACT|nr:DUF1080 domain-containing protein [Sediminibacterium goheungense]TDO26383.1 uncharacterized protein DUF1080 [Sediminibacterium goheungense]